MAAPTKLEQIDYSGRANWGTINPAGMGWTSPKLDPRKNPDMLVRINYKARSGVVLDFQTHRYWAPILTYALELLDPHIEGSFDGQNDKGSYNPRSTLQDGSPSMHAVAQASDLEWSQNPMGASPRPTGPHTLPANTDRLLRRLGIGWGGKWSDLRDWMHIENHLYPADTLELGQLITRLRAAGQEGMTMDAEVKAAFARLEAKIDDTPRRTWAFQGGKAKLAAWDVLSRVFRLDAALDKLDAVLAKLSNDEKNKEAK